MMATLHFDTVPGTTDLPPKAVPSSLLEWDMASRSVRALLEAKELLLEENLTRGKYVLRPRGGRKSPSDVFVNSAIEDAISDANWILQLSHSDQSDEEAPVPYEAATLAKAADVLRRIAYLAYSRAGLELTVPDINPAGNGSIDLFWDGSTSQLLMNIPAVGDYATYYGRNESGESISGTVLVRGTHPEITAWISQRQ